MKKLYAAILSFLVTPLYSQDLATDPKGDFIFGIPTINVQTELTPKNVGVNVPVRVRRKAFYVVPSINDTVYTMEKAYIFYVKANLVNNTKSSLVFNKKTNFSPSVELGYPIGFDSLFAPSAKRGVYFTRTYAITFDYQNFRYYDKNLKSFLPGRSNRISPGVKTNVTYFKGTTWAISLSAAFSNSIVTDDLVSYQNMSNTFYSDNNIASNGSNDGYFAPVKATNNLRISVAAPQFWISGNQQKIPFFVTPYYYILHKIDVATVHNAGIILTIIPDRFRRFDRESTGALSKNAGFKFSKALNIGYNALSNAKTDARYVFVSGTFSIGTVKGKLLEE